MTGQVKNNFLFRWAITAAQHQLGTKTSDGEAAKKAESSR